MLDIIDLTKILDNCLPIYAEEGYSDPPLEIADWCSIEGQGYKVSRLSLGTQTGTHIDAPAHFAKTGAALEALPVEALLGRYLFIDLDQAAESDLKTRRHGENILFLKSAKESGSEISKEFFDALLELPCLVWVIVYDVRITGQEFLYFNQRLAAAGKFLIENIDETAAQQVKPGGELIALPLRLTSVSGSPCRVIVRQHAG